MRIGCIDIGSNTTRLLVADVEAGRLREVLAQRHFTRIGASLGDRNAIPPEKIDEVSGIVAELATHARALGVDDLAIVATAAVRRATNGGALIEAVHDRAGAAASILSGREEAELSFAGARHAMSGPCEEPLAVVDVGGGSTEIAVGTAARGVRWAESIPIGSSLLHDRHLLGDPPTDEEIATAHAMVATALRGIDPPEVATAVAVGGTATSLYRLVGRALSREALEQGLARLCARPAVETAVALDLDEQRVRLMPAGIAVLCGVTDLLGRALSVAAGGLREGLLLKRAGVAS